MTGRAAEPAIRIGISACLLGERVRYDGGHKEDALVTRALAEFATLVPVCPEVELGMGTPREPIRLERGGDDVRLVAPGSGRDHTAAMQRYGEERVRQLAALGLSGYVFKRDSPSCGVWRVPVWSEGVASLEGRGVFARMLMEHLPSLPVEEEDRLHDPALRDEFVRRVLAYPRP